MGSRGGDKAPPRNDLLKSVQEVARGVSFGVSFSLLRSDLSSRGTTPPAQNTALVLHSVVRRDTRSPFRDQEVGGSNPLAPTRRGNALLIPVATSVATSPAVSLRSSRSLASLRRSIRSRS